MVSRAVTAEKWQESLNRYFERAQRGFIPIPPGRLLQNVFFWDKARQASEELSIPGLPENRDAS